MYIPAFLIYGSGLVGLCMLLVAFIYVYLYFRTNKALSSLEKEFTQYKSTSEKEAHEALVLAQKKAEQMINETEIFTVDMKKGLINALNQSVTKGVSTYNVLLSEIGNKTAGEILEVSKIIKDKAASGVGGISRTVDEETKKLTAELEASVKNQEKEYAKEAASAQEKALVELKSKVLSLLPMVLSDTVTRTLTPQEQEEIALNAIQKIKKEHGI